MFYSKIQKFTSSLLIFSMLFVLIFRVPFYDMTSYATTPGDFRNLVSILVDQNTYNNSSVKSKIETYADNISGVLENTQVVIIPFPTNTSAFKIASLNESLYFEWYKSVKNVSFESKLVWTVLVWDFKLPVVFKDNESSKTILPFTDFEDKSYIYNHVTNKYEENEENIGWLKAEVWHWVISANWDLNKLGDYFDKNNDFYKWEGLFKTASWILNGDNDNNNDWVKDNVIPWDYKPYVFYYDQFREEKAINYSAYRWYKAYKDNKTDIVYNKFSKDLALRVKDAVMWSWTADIVNMMDDIADWFNVDWTPKEWVVEFWSNTLEYILNAKQALIDAELEWLWELWWVPDIQTRIITKKLINTFVEIFWKWVLSDFRSDVNKSWRYNWKWW